MGLEIQPLGLNGALQHEVNELRMFTTFLLSGSSFRLLHVFVHQMPA